MPRPVRSCVRTGAAATDDANQEDFEPQEEPAHAQQPPPKKRKAEPKAKAKAKAIIHDNNLNEIDRQPLRPRNCNQLQLLSRPWNRSAFSALSERDLARPAVVEAVATFGVHESNSQLSARVTSLAWHPTVPGMAAVGSKHGDVLVWRRGGKVEEVQKGRGPGGSIQCLKFDTRHPGRFYTCSVDGTFKCTDLFQPEGSQKSFLSTGDTWRDWYTAFDVSPAGDTLMVGDNKGNVTLLDRDGHRVWSKRLHPKKVTNLQYSPLEPTSTDHSVRVWDVRKMDQRLQELPHVRAVNSAYFSSVDGTRLVTTDQHSELRVYAAPEWTLERVIAHPHRQFQHLSPIKATWHPHADIIVAGRYPDLEFPGTAPGELRSVDLIDPESGEVLHHLTQPGINKIMSLNLFSPDGDELLSGAGQSVLRWRRKEPTEEDDDEEGKFEPGSSMKIKAEQTMAATEKKKKRAAKK